MKVDGTFAVAITAKDLVLSGFRHNMQITMVISVKRQRGNALVHTRRSRSIICARGRKTTRASDLCDAPLIRANEALDSADTRDGSRWLVGYDGSVGGRMAKSIARAIEVSRAAMVIHTVMNQAWCASQPC
jgi:hypothetical protein